MLTSKLACRKCSDCTLLFLFCKLSRDDKLNRTAGGLTQEATRSHSQCWLFVADTKSGFVQGRGKSFKRAFFCRKWAGKGGRRKAKRDGELHNAVRDLVAILVVIMRDRCAPNLRRSRTPTRLPSPRHVQPSVLDRLELIFIFLPSVDSTISDGAKRSVQRKVFRPGF